MAAAGALQVTAASALEVLHSMNLGALSSRQHIESLLETIQQLEPQVQAWAHLDVSWARQQADRADACRPAAPSQPLLGVAVGLKDIIDTAELPTENGTVLHAGRRPPRDAALVERLRGAGAVVLGKTVTTELATYAPGKTRNPHRLTHTPGGSSSGSAAAVACGMVPLAVGSQTNGSTIRPAAFCGVVSFKPTQASIDRTGMLVQSPSFDTVGLFARTVPDVALLWRVLRTPLHEPTDPGEPCRRLTWFTGPLQDRLEPGIGGRLVDRARCWGARINDGPSDLPMGLQAVIDLHRLIMEAEIARSFGSEYERGAAQLSASLRGQIERGRQTSDSSLAAAQRTLKDFQDQCDDWMRQAGIDVLVTPSAPGPAPEGLSATGDPVFCTLATALDLPALQLPGLVAPNGLPLGIQLVARRAHDAALLALGEQLAG